MQKEKRVLDRLQRSSLYKDYEQAFRAGTKLPLTLRGMEYWQIPHQGQPQQNPFSVLLARKSKGCAACLETSQKLAEAAKSQGANGPVTVKCFAGLCDSGVPLRFGSKTIGMLQTGQVAPGASEPGTVSNNRGEANSVGRRWTSRSLRRHTLSPAC